MRLEKIRKGQGLGRILFPLMRLKIGARVPDVVRTIFYRPKFFGHGYNAWMQAVMRGPSAWSIWERELFASFTSSRNQCVF